MAKRIENMSLNEVMAEFDETPKYRMPKRRQSLVLLTLRVPPEVKKRLSAEALKRGASGYTSVARDLIERGLAADTPSRSALVSRIAKATADEVVTRLRRRRAV